MLRPWEVIIRLALEHFKRNIQITLLEMRSYFLHNSSKFVFFKYIQTFNVDKR
jgi:hypothetical protein